MFDIIKDALPRSLAFSIVFTLIGIPMGHYHVDRMALEMFRAFVITFIVYLVVNTFYSWIIEKAKAQKR